MEHIFTINSDDEIVNEESSEEEESESDEDPDLDLQFDDGVLISIYIAKDHKYTFRTELNASELY